MTTVLMALILKYSMMYSVDPRLVVAVVQAESEFKVDARGPFGEIGLMQLMPESFPGYTEEQLERPDTNIHLGIRHLAESMRRCKHKSNMTWVVCYNLGVKGGSRIRYPRKFIYYRRVMKAYKEVPERAKDFPLVLSESFSQ